MWIPKNDSSRTKMQSIFSYITIYLWRDLWFVPNHLSSFRKLRSFGRMLPFVKNIPFLFFSTNHTQPFNTLVGMNNCGRMDISIGFIWLFGGDISKHAIRVCTTSLYFLTNEKWKYSLFNLWQDFLFLGFGSN